MGQGRKLDLYGITDVRNDDGIFYTAYYKCLNWFSVGLGFFLYGIL